MTHPCNFQALVCASDPTDPDRCEDNYALDCERGLAAIADGAGTTFDPKHWSAVLAQAACNIPGRLSPSSIGQAWENAMRGWSKRPMPKLAPGLDPKPSASTLGIVEVVDDSWAVACVGDVNVIVWDGANSVCGLPHLASASQYNTTPDLLPDRTQCEPAIESWFVTGRCAPGSVLFLFTDGLGAWLVENLSNDILHTLATIELEGFVAFIESIRLRPKVAVDDATLIRYRFRAASNDEQRRRADGPNSDLTC